LLKKNKETNKQTNKQTQKQNKNKNKRNNLFELGFILLKEYCAVENFYR